MVSCSKMTATIIDRDGCLALATEWMVVSDPPADNPPAITRFVYRTNLLTQDFPAWVGRTATHFARYTWKLCPAESGICDGTLFATDGLNTGLGPEVETK